MFNRIVTFGCSITYGHGLEDCCLPNNDAGPVCSKNAWPHLLGNLLSIETVDNKAAPGISNLEILHNILQYDFKSTDLVAIMWSWPNRDIIFGSPLTRIGPWNDDTISTTWFQVHTEDDTLTRSWMYIHYADLFLKSKNINALHMNMEYNKMKASKPEFIPTNDLEINLYELSITLDKALDNLHPGPEFHSIVANKLKDILNEY